VTGHPAPATGTLFKNSVDNLCGDSRQCIFDANDRVTKEVQQWVLSSLFLVESSKASSEEFDPGSD
jgi:hypothetical protein